MKETTSFERKQPWIDWTVFYVEQVHILYLVRVLIYVIILYLRNIMKCKTSFSHPKVENKIKKNGYRNWRIYVYFGMSDESYTKQTQCNKEIILSYVHLQCVIGNFSHYFFPKKSSANLCANSISIFLLGDYEYLQPVKSEIETLCVLIYWQNNPRTLNPESLPRDILGHYEKELNHIYLFLLLQLLMLRMIVWYLTSSFTDNYCTSAGTSRSSPLWINEYNIYTSEHNV